MSFLDDLKAQKGLGKPQALKKKEASPRKGVRINPPKEKKKDPKVITAKDLKSKPVKMTHVKGQGTREKWLERASVMIEESIMPENVKIPNFRVSIGFPLGSRGSAKRTLGVYYPGAMTSDGVPQIFISPSPQASGKPCEMLAVLVHEMVHAAHPGEGHGPIFRKTALECGLEGLMTATVASSHLRRDLKRLAKELGEFPHGTIDISKRPKQSTRMLRHECSECGLIFYMSQKWIDAVETMVCPNGDCGGWPS